MMTKKLDIYNRKKTGTQLTHNQPNNTDISTTKYPTGGIFGEFFKILN